MHNTTSRNSNDVNIGFLTIKSMLLMMSESFMVSKGSAFLLKEASQSAYDTDSSEIMWNIDKWRTQYNLNPAEFIYQVHRELINADLSFSEKIQLIGSLELMLNYKGKTWHRLSILKGIRSVLQLKASEIPEDLYR